MQLRPFGEEIRFGPETSEVNVPMMIQYWNGSEFKTSRMDNFTTFDATADAIVVDISLTPATTSPSCAGTFVYGLADAMLSAPGVNNQGEVLFSIEVLSWLQYDWSNTDTNFDGPYTDNPYATVTFGLFRGNDRSIHWREVTN